MKVTTQPYVDQLLESIRLDKIKHRLAIAAIEHFAYSIEDIKSYDELSKDEKKIFETELEFNSMIKNIDTVSEIDLSKLIDHLRYSVNDIEKYTELTKKERGIISKEIFNVIKFEQ